MRNVSDKSCRENPNTHFSLNNFFFFQKSCCFIENVGKNIVDPDWPQMTIRRMRNAFWIPESTNTHSEHATLTAFSTTTMVERIVELFLFSPSFRFFCLSYFYNFLPYLCKKKILFRLLCFYVISNLSLFYVFFFPCSVMSIFPSLICSLSLFCFLVCLSSFPLFLPVSNSSLHARCHWQLTGQLLPFTSVVDYPQQMYLKHLRTDHNIWPFQAVSGRHARLVSTSDNTVE